MTTALPLVLATGNDDKAREIVEIFVVRMNEPLAAWALTFGADTYGYILDRPETLQVSAQHSLRDRVNVEETGDTLEANARIKARALADALGMLAISDDTGLEVEALGGAPGVRSARYAGEDSDADANVKLLLYALDGVAPSQRTARFATVALARWPDGAEVVTRGEVEGTITTEPRGTAGFGYDPVFVPLEGDGRTFAEMTRDEKHAISHRGRAFRALAAALEQEKI
jgi:XTP/dITP diphosphohydrolase